MLLPPWGIQSWHKINPTAALVEQVKSENNYQSSMASDNSMKPLNMPVLQVSSIACNSLN